MRVPKVNTVDFETDRIEDRPEYPPKPVGVAIIEWGKAPKYYAWGHPYENNCSKAEARKVLMRLWRMRKEIPLLFHNAKFDIEVAFEYLNLPIPKWTEYHDTLFFAFAYDPREPSFSLKPLADKHLNMPPEEQDELKEWILENIPEAKKKPSTWGAYIAKAPGKLVGRYAKGDVIRTLGLYKIYHEDAVFFKTMDAYDRDRRLMPKVMKMERRGIPIKYKKLQKDMGHEDDLKIKKTLKGAPTWYQDRHRTEKRIYRKLGGEFNLGSPKQLAERLDHYGLVSDWILTDKGNKSVKMENLAETITDTKLLADLKRRSVLSKFIGTYGEPWVELATTNGGIIYPSINQVRGSYHNKGGDDKGTYTGRFSMVNPSFHSVPRTMGDPTMPVIRNYIAPFPDEVLIGRDYSQQELRILAHFEQGALFRQYQENPWVDAHDAIGDIIAEVVGIRFERKDVKTNNFGTIYGMGTKKLAKKMGKSMVETKLLRNAMKQALPGAAELMQELSKRGRNGEAIRTWGGRIYYVEDPKVFKGRVITFEYKLLNTLIQGSAADCTKEAMIRVDEACEGQMMLQVHDELLSSVPKAHYKEEMQAMREAMESIEFDVPMLSDGKWGRNSWGEMRKYKDPMKKVA